MNPNSANPGSQPSATKPSFIVKHISLDELKMQHAAIDDWYIKLAKRLASKDPPVKTAIRRQSKYCSFTKILGSDSKNLTEKGD